MKTWFTADCHFDHANLVHLGGRPHKDIDTWNDLFIHEINDKVERRDRLIILGDFAWNFGIAKWKHRIRCRNVFLILGNHDVAGKCRAAFGPEQVRLTWEVKIRDTKVWLSHYPHFVWPSSHHGSMHLYGHCHDQREQFLDKLFPERRSMDVGPESAARLGLGWTIFEDDYIYDRLMARRGHDNVEFYKSFQLVRRLTDPNWGGTLE